MSRNTIVWMALCVATLVAHRAVAAGEPWRVAEQPELKKALERAPLLRTESLGEPARGVNVWERWVVPNPDGKSCDLLQIYFKEYYGPTWLCAVDLGTGEVKKQRLADGRAFKIKDFRDYLIAHPQTARAYERLKRDLAAAHPNDRVAYTNGKTAFIQRVTAKAKESHAHAG